MKTILALGLVAFATVSSASTDGKGRGARGSGSEIRGASNAENWDCRKANVMSEERGKIGTRDVCVLEASCFPTDGVFFLPNSVNTPYVIKSYCEPNRSNRCTTSMDECLNSNKIAKADIPKIKFYNANPACASTDAPTTARGATKGSNQ